MFTGTEEARYNPIEFINKSKNKFPSHRKPRRYVRMRDLTHLPMEFRIFVMSYIKTGRVDVAYDCAFPEDGGSIGAQFMKGKAILSKPEVGQEVDKALASMGVQKADCFRVLKEVMDLPPDSCPKLAAIKLKAAMSLLDLLDVKMPAAGTPTEVADEGINLSLVEGMQEADALKEKRNTA